MTECSYDVTNPDEGVQTLQTKSTKSFKIICFLTIISCVLIGVIVFLLFFDKTCVLREKYEPNEEIRTGKIQTTTDLRSLETIPSIDLRMMETSTELATNKEEDDWEMMTCKSSECTHTAAHMLNSMDFTVKPCENFHDFACGRMEMGRDENLDIIAPKILKKTNSTFLRKLRTFYDSCLNHENKFDYKSRINTTRLLLERIGSFKIDGRGNTTFNITHFIANMILYDSMPFFNIDIDIDPDNSTYIMKLLMPDQTSLRFDHWSAMSETRRKCLRQTGKLAYEKTLNMTILYEHFLLCQKNYADYLDSISTTLDELGFFANLNEKDAFTHIRNIRIFIEFEILSKFDEIPIPPNLQEDYVKRNYENVKIDELERKFPLIEWEKLFGLISRKRITKDTVIQMYNREYFEDVFEKIAGVKSINFNNALLAILATSLYENTVLPSHRHDRRRHCVKRIRELMPDIVNYLYKEIVEVEDLDKSNAVIVETFQFLKEKFLKSLENREWLDDVSKNSIKSKLDKIQLETFDKKNLDVEAKYLDEAYGILEVKGNNYQLNNFYLIAFKKSRLLSLHGEKVTLENMYSHFADVTDEKPLFSYANNLVYIPHGLTKKVVKNLPQYLILAQVGFPLAKIIGQAFDRIGIKYGVNLTENARNSYTYSADQTRDMLVLMNPIKFASQLFYFNLNNDLSESERISDNTAMRLMTDSFATFENQPLLPWISRKFSKEAIFFLHLTQGLCRNNMDPMRFMVESYESPVLPPQFRIGNVLGNSEIFLKLFDCRPGSGMSGIEERIQFPYLPNVDETL